MARSICHNFWEDHSWTFLGTKKARKFTLWDSVAPSWCPQCAHPTGDIFHFSDLLSRGHWGLPQPRYSACHVFLSVFADINAHRCCGQPVNPTATACLLPTATSPHLLPLLLVAGTVCCCLSNTVGRGQYRECCQLPHRLPWVLHPSGWQLYLPARAARWKIGMFIIWTDMKLQTRWMGKDRLLLRRSLLEGWKWPEKKWS